MFRAAVVSALVGGAAAAQCPKDIKVLDTLDLKRYPGTWYEVASENLPFLSGCSCSVYDYKMTGAQTFDDHFSCTTDGKPQNIGLTLKGKIPDLSKPAVQEESPVAYWLPTAPYLVLEVGKDYEYAVVYACVEKLGFELAETTYIFHRDPQALSKGFDLEGVKTRMKAQGIAVDKILTVPHPTTCSYPSNVIQV